MLCKCESRDHCDAPRSAKDAQGTARNEERGMKQILPHNFGRNQPCRHPDLGLPASPGLWDNTFLLSKPFYLWNFKQQPQKTNTASLESFHPLVQVVSKGATSDVGSSSPQTLKSPAATLVFSAEAADYRHQTAEMYHCCCVLTEFLTHKVRKQNKQPLF